MIVVVFVCIPLVVFMARRSNRNCDGGVDVGVEVYADVDDIGGVDIEGYGDVRSDGADCCDVDVDGHGDGDGDGVCDGDGDGDGDGDDPNVLKQKLKLELKDQRHDGEQENTKPIVRLGIWLGVILTLNIFWTLLLEKKYAG